MEDRYIKPNSHLADDEIRIEKLMEKEKPQPPRIYLV